jgi:hypothetical protein
MNVEIYRCAEWSDYSNSALIMAGVIEDVLLQKPDVAVGLFRRTLSVLQRLRESWVGAAKVERGVVFEDTFLFGVQRLFFEAGIQVRVLLRHVLIFLCHGAHG